MPRMLAGLIIGGALAIAGLLMQQLPKTLWLHHRFWCECRCFLRYCTYNCTYTISRLLLYNFSDNWCLLRRFYCYTLSGSTKSITPIKLALAGMAIHLFFSSMTQGIIILNEDSNDTVMFWLVGSLAGIKWQQIIFILPFYSLFCDHIYGKTINYIRVR